MVAGLAFQREGVEGDTPAMSHKAYIGKRASKHR